MQMQNFAFVFADFALVVQNVHLQLSFIKCKYKMEMQNFAFAFVFAIFERQMQIQNFEFNARSKGASHKLEKM